MFTGECKYIWFCPSCARVYGGVAEGGILKLCDWCPHRGLCDVSERDDIPRAERVCNSIDCILYQVLGVPARIKAGEYYGS